MVKKVLLSIIIALGFVLGLGVKTSLAQSDSGTLRHAYKPHTVTEGVQAGWMNARVDNFSSTPSSRLVCVEAFNVKGGHKTHLGCLNVSTTAFMGDSWAAEFNAPTNWLKPGTYKVVYTYQGTDGVWHRVMSMTLRVQDGVYVR